MKINANLTQTMGKIGRTLSKNSPIILTVGGVVGLGTTAVLSYKAAKKVEVIVDDIEARRLIEEDFAALEALESRTTSQNLQLAEYRGTVVPIDRYEVARRLAGAVALPVATGLGSIILIALSYQIQNNRIVNLAAALATATAEKAFYDAKFKAQYGEAEYDKFHTPTVKENVTVMKNGKEKVIETDVRKNLPSINGEWFDKSSEYASDDHDYNMQYIRSKEANLQHRMFRKGFLLQNEVLEALGFERTRQGALLGWSTATGFDITTSVTNVVDENGEFVPQIYVRWTTPESMYQKVDFESSALL